MKCPIHGDIDLQVANKVNGQSIPLEMNVWRCPESERFWKGTDEGLVPLSEDGLMSRIERHKEMKKEMEEAKETAEMMGVPTRAESQAMNVAREHLSSQLFEYTQEVEGDHRAYTVDEIIQACARIGVDPKQVTGKTVAYVRHWLFDNLGRWERQG